MTATGADLVVGVGAHVGIDPKRHRRAQPARRRHLAERDQLGHQFDIELGDAGIERLHHLVAALADAGEHDALRRHAGRERPLQLAAGHDLRAGARLREGAHDRKIAVRLERVADHHPLAGERGEEPAQPLAHDRAGIDVGGRADRGGDLGERHRSACSWPSEVAEASAHSADSSFSSRFGKGHRIPVGLGVLDGAGRVLAVIRVVLRRQLERALPAAGGERSEHQRKNEGAARSTSSSKEVSVQSIASATWLPTNASPWPASSQMSPR